MIAANEKGYLPLHARDQPAAGPEGRDRHAARGGARQRLRPPRPRRRGDAPLRARTGASRSSAATRREYSSSLTAVRLPEGHSADALRAEILERSNMSLGNGLGPLADTVFRIGHLGDFHDLMVTGTLAGVEMGLKALRHPAPIRRGRGRHDVPRRQYRGARRRGGINPQREQDIWREKLMHTSKKVACALGASMLAFAARRTPPGSRRSRSRSSSRPAPAAPPTRWRA